MPPPREGSRKASIYTTFHEKGVDAAIALGAELNLQPGTIRSWIGTWAKESGQDVNLKGKASGPKPAKVINGRRVREIGFPMERKGTIMQEGPEGSVVRWDNGDVRPVTNKYLIKLKPDGSDDEDVKSEWQREEEQRFLKRKERKKMI